MTMHEARSGGHEMNSHIEDAGLIELSGRLDDLGRAERGGAPAGLEDRLLSCVRGAEAPQLRYIDAPAPPLVRAGPALRRWMPLPMAAALAVAATIGAVWLNNRNSQPATSRMELAALTLEQDVNQWLSLPDVIGQELDAELAALDAEASRLSAKSDESANGLESLIEEGAL
ncbi:MAG: hypothetical protein IT436_06825 [Phycisphaerales bacterium]|nr:hypothetical protein [Phycisphaerales bacterium]